MPAELVQRSKVPRGSPVIPVNFAMVSPLNIPSVPISWSVSPKRVFIVT